MNSAESLKNLPAIVFCQKAGFSNLSYRPNYYDNGTTGALIFEIVVFNIAWILY